MSADTLPVDVDASYRAVPRNVCKVPCIHAHGPCLDLARSMLGSRFQCRSGTYTLWLGSGNLSIMFRIHTKLFIRRKVLTGSA